eukprot:TRINITY_DN1724_c0_g1_i1.p2 TRINITY_DN1724_c0_g1~~TRINITY_DN1724_c0_g1_i1.p2  ORF type:complete len:56 (-),score=3.23 TRINITY_DN1724_c0_g1_i1:182-349(-)
MMYFMSHAVLLGLYCIFYKQLNMTLPKYLIKRTPVLVYNKLYASLKRPKKPFGAQ